MLVGVLIIIGLLVVVGCFDGLGISVDVKVLGDLFLVWYLLW